LRFLIRKLEGKNDSSSFSQWLESLKPGDQVGVGTPFGWFHPGQSKQEVWFATGTGISPFLAVLSARQPVQPLAFCIGARDPEEAINRVWLEQRAPVHWAFSRISEKNLPQRKVTDLAADVPVNEKICYFLCGNQRMILAVSEILRNRGVAPSQIHEELFYQ